MPLLRRAKKNFLNFNMPVSYKVGAQKFLKDSRNVCTIQDLLETRHGISRWNSTAFSSDPKSISFFKDNNSNRYLLAKDGTILYRANATGAHTELKTGLVEGHKHRGVTLNNRHIIAIEDDGLYSYDGTIFSPLGQEGPQAPTVANSGSGNSLTASDYKVRLTYYSTQTGFESNGGIESSLVTVASGEQIDVSDIPITATNLFIDKVRIYLKDITNDSEYFFWKEIALSIATDTIDADPSSTQIPPTKNAPPIAGGAKYLAVFGQALSYSGNTNFPSDIFITEDFIPDATDDTTTSKTINIAGNGPLTGHAVGYASGFLQNPYIVAFKKNHIELYNEANGIPQQVVISNEVGCISGDTIKVINGDVFFMSAKGWSVISGGKLFRSRENNESIDNGEINDIFTRSGFTFELNKANAENFFSVYYPTLQQYLTFVSEGSNDSISKAYNYEFATSGFRPYEFPVTFTSGVLGEDSTNEDVVFLAGQNGYIYTHSIKEEVGTDVDLNGNNVAVDAFAQLFWISGDDLESSYNFGPLILRALAQENPIIVKFFLDYTQGTSTDKEYSFDNPETGFILDVSKLDEGIFSDSRTIVRFVGEILRSGQSLLIGLYKSDMGESMALINGQLDVQKNGNPN